MKIKISKLKSLIAEALSGESFEQTLSTALTNPEFDQYQETPYEYWNIPASMFQKYGIESDDWIANEEYQSYDLSWTYFPESDTVAIFLD